MELKNFCTTTEWKLLSRVQLFEAPLDMYMAMEFSRPEYWSG